MLLLLVQEGLRPSADLVCDIYTRYVMRCDVVVLNCFYFLVSLSSLTSPSSLSSPSSPSSPSTATIAMVCYFWRDWCAISGEIGVLFLARLVCYFRRDWCAISSEIGVLFLARLVCYFRRDWCAISGEKIKIKIPF